MKARGSVVLLVLVLLVSLSACRARDPRQRVLEERALWKVQLLDWVTRDDGAVSLSVRVSGPPSSVLDELTVRLVFQDGSGSPIGDTWLTLDLSGIQRGGPEDMSLRVTPDVSGIEGIGIDPVLAPTPDESARIPELRI